LNITDYWPRVPEVIPVPTTSLTIVDGPKATVSEKLHKRAFAITLSMVGSMSNFSNVHNWSFPFTFKCATNTCVLSTVLVEENFLDLIILNENRDTLPVISMSIIGWPCNARLLFTIPKVVSVDSIATTCINSYKNGCSLIEGGMTGAVIAAAWKVRVAETTRGAWSKTKEVFNFYLLDSYSAESTAEVKL